MFLHATIIAMKGMLILSILLFPTIAFGQDPGGLVTCSGPDCNFCTFVSLVDGLIAWLFGFLVLAAILILVVAGFKLVVSAGNPSAMTAAKGMISNVIIGFVIVMAAWLIVDTMLKALLRDTDNFGIWNDLDGGCGGFNTSAQVVGEDGEIVAVNPATGEQYTDAEARALIAANPNISIWESAPGRTQLGGINQATLNEVTRIQQACGCAVAITGGTESGHAPGAQSHSSGYKIDIDDTAAVNSYLTSTYVRNGSRSDGTALYRDPNRPGVEYAREGDHWDITVN